MKVNNKTQTQKERLHNVKKVTSNYEHEQEVINEGYEILENLDDDVTKTSKIVMLGNIRIPATYIAKMLDTHYSFVHTILVKNEIEVVEKRTKSDEMREMFDDGMTISQVAKKMSAHYSYVHGVYTRYMNKK